MNVLTKAFAPPVRYNLPKTLSRNNPNSKTAKSLKKTRRYSGISQDRLSGRAGLPLNDTVAVEYGVKTNPTIETLPNREGVLTTAFMI
jgi:hypothetical protein